MENVNLRKLVNICEDPKVLLDNLQKWGLVPKQGDYFCQKCSAPLLLKKGITDGYRWRCSNKIRKYKQKPKLCGKVVSLRKGTLFEASKLSLFQILGFVNLWVANCSFRLIKNQLEISTKACVNWASFCREVVYNHFVLNPIKIGGCGITVEIDESKVGSKKINQKKEEWVFGGYERGTGRVFMVVVEKRDTDTLLPIIKKWIEKGTTIISNCSKSYDCLVEHGYQHISVNQSLHFVDPETSAHTNAMKSSWRHAKALMPSNRSTKRNIPGNLARYMFNKQCAELNLDRTTQFYKLAGDLYNPCRPSQQCFVDEDAGIDQEDNIDSDEGL